MANKNWGLYDSLQGQHDLISAPRQLTAFQSSSCLGALPSLSASGMPLYVKAAVPFAWNLFLIPNLPLAS